MLEIQSLYSPVNDHLGKQDQVFLKEQKEYEKKLKQYEKEKARWDYFQKNKARIVKNKEAVRKSNYRKKRIYNGRGEYEGYSRLIKNHGFVGKESTMKFWEDNKTSNELRNQIERLKKAISGDKNGITTIIGHDIHLMDDDKKYNFYPSYDGSWMVDVMGEDALGIVLQEHPIFSFPPLPKQAPIPPEKPLVNNTASQQLNELKQEVIQSQEMNISRRTIDTKGNIIKREIMIDGRSTLIEPQTYDLYIKFKSTRNQRPHDLDYSFSHFQKNYLDQNPQYMRK